MAICCCTNTDERSVSLKKIGTDSQVSNDYMAYLFRIICNGNQN